MRKANSLSLLDVTIILTNIFPRCGGGGPLGNPKYCDYKTGLERLLTNQYFLTVYQINKDLILEHRPMTMMSGTSRYYSLLADSRTKPSPIIKKNMYNVKVK